MPDSQKNRVYKIVPAAMWAGAVVCGAFDGSDDDTRDGYIHLSNAAQLPGTIGKYFHNQTDLLLIAFNAADLGPQLVWEASRGGDLFPHYYGRLPVKLALWQRPLPLGSDGVPQFDQDSL